MTAGNAGAVGDARKRIEELVDRSSFGAPEAKALRASVTDEQTARVVQRARELDAPNAGTDPLAEAIWNASRADEGTISATGANHVAAVVRAHFAALLADESTVEKVAQSIYDTPLYMGAGGNATEAEGYARAALAAIAGLIEEESRG